MTYKSVIATQYGGPEVLRVIENDLRLPSTGEVRIKVLAATVSRPDLTVRAGKALYSGTPLGYKPPFVPGYVIIGDIDAVGDQVTGAAVGDRVGVMTVIGGCSEVYYCKPDRLIPVPASLDPAEAAVLILNYIVAYQTLHRSAKVQTGEKALIIGASGGIGTALLQLGRLAGLQMYGLASSGKHSTLKEYGAVPIDYHTQDFVKVLRNAEPDGIDVVLDGMTQPETIRKALSLLRSGGRLVSFGEPASFWALFQTLAILLRTNLLPGQKSVKLYGTSFYFVGRKEPFLEDWATLFKLLEAGRIRPVIDRTYPLLEAAQAHTRLESGAVIGNLVLLAPELLA